MSLEALIHLHGVPGLHAAVTILTAIYSDLQDVKLYKVLAFSPDLSDGSKHQCKYLWERCVNLMISLQEDLEGLQGLQVLEVVDDIEIVICRIDRKVKQWASWGRLMSFLQQGEIKDGIGGLHRDIDVVAMKFNVRINMKLARVHLETQQCDKEELRELLQMIVQSTDDMRSLYNMRSSRPVDEIIEILQAELMDPSLQPKQEQSFREGLLLLHEKTDELPLLTNCNVRAPSLLSYTETIASDETRLTSLS